MFLYETCAIGFSTHRAINPYQKLKPPNGPFSHSRSHINLYIYHTERDNVTTVTIQLISRINLYVCNTVISRGNIRYSGEYTASYNNTDIHKSLGLKIHTMLLHCLKQYC